MAINLDDIHSNGVWQCAKCGEPITPFNYSGWEAFVGNGSVTQPICRLCEHVEDRGPQAKAESSGPLVA